MDSPAPYLRKGRNGMYVTQDAACLVPNSSTPVSPSAIAAGQAVMQAMQNLVSNANAAMAQIVARPDLNAAGQPLPVNANGQPIPPTVGNSGSQPVREFDTAPVPAGVSQVLQRWPKMCTGRSLAENLPTPQSCYSIPPPMPASPSLTLPPVGIAAPPAPAPAAAPPANFKPPTTGNICMDIQKGYVQQSQVSPEQLADCSMKQYYLMGNNPTPEPLRSQLQAYFSANVGKLPMFPDQPNVPPYRPGMSGYGMGQAPGFSWGWAGAAGLTAAAYLLFFNKPGRR